ncbi:MAG TPA: DNA-formamidopyrimidine glycosylase family protein [Solirubrobacterales bacterium]|nr:DNA-formamidopyrimidine glycosylase family protein [Solirubrobacterales bacterium]
MAEGDTILRLARRLDEALAGEAVAVRAPGPRRPTGLPIAEIDGHRLERVESRGKHLLFRFDGAVLHSHLGMRGSWDLHRLGERWRRPAFQAWLALAADGVEAVNFGGSMMRIATEAQLLRDPRLARLGPDLLADGFDYESAVARLRSRGPELKLGEALLGQRLVAGIGNIFRSEGCFEARLDPNDPIGVLTDDQVVRVLEATRGLMLEAAETGRQPHRVYRQAGRPCPRCGSPIQSRAQGDSARVSYWCPRCQPASG